MDKENHTIAFFDAKPYDIKSFDIEKHSVKIAGEIMDFDVLFIIHNNYKWLISFCD